MYGHFAVYILQKCSFNESCGCTILGVNTTTQRLWPWILNKTPIPNKAILNTRLHFIWIATSKTHCRMPLLVYNARRTIIWVEQNVTFTGEKIKTIWAENWKKLLLCMRARGLYSLSLSDIQYFVRVPGSLP